MRITIVFIISFLFCYGCSEPTVNDQLVGDVTGTVGLLDEFGRHEADQSGTSITIEGLHTYHGISDAAGKWTIHNVETGFYTISFQKKGYMSITDKNFFSFIGDGPVKYKNSYDSQSGVGLIKPISIPVCLDAFFTSKFISDTVTPNILYAHVPTGRPVGTKANFILIVGKNPDLTIFDPASYEQSNVYGYYSDTSVVNISIPIDYSTVPFKGFVRGERIYVRPYSYYGLLDPFRQIRNKNITLADYPDTSMVLSNVVQ